jgi:hypothetical protein
VATGVPAAAVFTPGVQSNTIIGNLQGGNPNVGIEKSDTYTFGAVITPRALPGLAVSVDYFNIDLDGAISALGGGLNNTLNLCYNIVQNASSEFCQAIKRNPVTGEIAPPYYATITNANTGGLKTAGVDFVANYRFSADFGLPHLSQESRFEIGTEWTWTDEFTSTPVQAFPNIKNYCVGRVWPDLRPADPRMEGRDAGHLADRSADPQPQAPLHRRGRDRQVHPAQARGRDGSGHGQPDQPEAAGPELLRRLVQLRHPRERPGVRRRQQHRRQGSAGAGQLVAGGQHLRGHL